MARLVVLSFEDNDDAETFVQTLPIDDTFQVKIEGLFALPTQFCEGSYSSGCSTWKGKLGDWGRFWTVGKKYGWRVCITCHKPAKPIRGRDNLMRNVIETCVNLLPEAQPVDETRPNIWDAGWGVSRNWIMRDNARVTNLGWNKAAGNDDLLRFDDDGNPHYYVDDRYDNG